jgi:hypothetical protein
MTPAKLSECLRYAAGSMGVPLSWYKGRTVRQLFRDSETLGGMRVFYGLFPVRFLDSYLTGALCSS